MLCNIISFKNNVFPTPFGLNMLGLFFLLLLQHRKEKMIQQQKSLYLWAEVALKNRPGTKNPLFLCLFLLNFLWQFNPVCFNNLTLYPFTPCYSGPGTLSIIDSSVIDEISSKVQDLVEKINNSRASDQRVMDSFQEELMTKVLALVHYFCSCPGPCRR